MWPQASPFLSLSLRAPHLQNDSSEAWGWNQESTFLTGSLTWLWCMTKSENSWTIWFYIFSSELTAIGTACLTGLAEGLSWCFASPWCKAKNLAHRSSSGWASQPSFLPLSCHHPQYSPSGAAAPQPWVIVCPSPYLWTSHRSRGCRLPGPHGGLLSQHLLPQSPRHTIAVCCKTPVGERMGHSTNSHPQPHKGIFSPPPSTSHNITTHSCHTDLPYLKLGREMDSLTFPSP